MKNIKQKVSMIVWNDFRNDARVLKEAQTLSQSGYNVTVFALHSPGLTNTFEILDGGINVKRVSRSPFWSLRKRSLKTSNQSVNLYHPQNPNKLSLFKQLLRIFARMWTHLLFIYELYMSKPDVIHSHDVNTLPTAWFASLLARVPLVYDAHEISTDREGYASIRKLVGAVEKFLMPRVAGTITTTDLRAKFFRRAYKIESPLVLQNRPRFTQVDNKDLIRKKLNLKSEKLIVLYQGGIQQGRGLDVLLESAKVIEKAYFVFIGGGRLKNELVSKANSMNLQSRVFFIDTLPLADLPEYTASADIGVQPLVNTCLNHFTTDSNKLFEYVQAGIPVISSDFPEIRKIVEKFGVGMLIKDGDLKSLCVAIQFMIDNAEERRSFSKNAVFARTDLSWEVQEHLLVELYAKILKI